MTDLLARAAADLKFLADHADHDARLVALDVPSVRALAALFEADPDGIGEAAEAAASVLLGEV